MILSSLLQAIRKGSRVSIARTANDLYTKEMKLIVVVDPVLTAEGLLPQSSDLGVLVADLNP